MVDVYGNLLQPEMRTIVALLKQAGVDYKAHVINVLTEEGQLELQQRDPSGQGCHLEVDGSKVIGDLPTLIKYLATVRSMETVYSMTDRKEIDQWLNQNEYQLKPMSDRLMKLFTLSKDAKYKMLLKDELESFVKNQVTLSKFVEGKNFLVGNHLTAADISIVNTLCAFHHICKASGGQTNPVINKWFDQLVDTNESLKDAVKDYSLEFQKLQQLC